MRRPSKRDATAKASCTRATSGRSTGTRTKSPFPLPPHVRSRWCVKRWGFCGVLITDGDTVYERFAQTVNRVVHAQCWAHCRRQFVEAQPVEPALVAQALEFVGALYAQEARGQQRGREEAEKLAYRGEHVKPIVDAFFAWLTYTLSEQVLLPTNPFTQAARYALEREAALRVFLEYPNVPLGRVDDWRGLRRLPVAVVAPFGDDAAVRLALAPFPAAARRTGRAALPHPALIQNFTSSRSTGFCSAPAA